MASMDEFEDRLRTYDQDLERYERLSEQKVGELAFVHLQDMIPQEVRARFDNEKHNFSKVVHLMEFFRRVIEDYKASAPKKKVKALNELVARMAEEETADSEEGNLLFSLLCHASEEDVAKVLSPSELMTFVKWRSKGGGGKGYNGGSYAARAGGNKGLSGAGFGKGVDGAASGSGK